MKFSEYSEEKRHGIRAFPVEYYFLSESHPQYIMHPHWHKELEAIRILSGEFRLFLNNEDQILRSGDIIFFGGGVLHRGEPVNCVYECIVFDIDMLNRGHIDLISNTISLLQNGTNEIDCPPIDRASPIYTDATKLFECMRMHKTHHELLVCSLLFSILYGMYECDIIRPASKRSQVGKQTQRIVELLSWIEKHFSEPITLKMLSDISGMSEKYICRIFKEYTSRSPISYINELRIELACHEITKNNRSITEVAYDCGFNDSAYFCKTFKQYKHMTPSEYRHRIAQNDDNSTDTYTD